MKNSKRNQKFFNVLTIGILTVFYLFSNSKAEAQNNCENIKNHGQGYTASIRSVTENGNNSYTIELNVKHNGQTDGSKPMARYSVEAKPGTYSNVFITLISGNLNYKNIDLGPNLAGDPFKGFRITGTSGFGSGSPGEFLITYTLSGGLQDQRAQVKAGSNLLQVAFTRADFQNVLSCNMQNIFPYYTPPVGGKLVSIIGPELNSLYNFYVAGGTLETNDIFQIFGSDVLIEINVLDGQFALLLNLLQTSYGLYDVVNDDSQITITGKIPVLNLLSLNSLVNYINFARPVYPPIVSAGIVTSLGDIAMRSDFARSGFKDRKSVV